jgi:uncharacterized protein (TIGR02246 family)
MKQLIATLAVALSAAAASTTAAAAATTASAASAASTSSAASTAAAIDAAGIEHGLVESLKTVARFADKAWNERDAKTMAALYNESATASIGGAYLSGKTAILDYFTSSFGKLPSGLTHRTEVRRIVRIGDMYAADTDVYLEMADQEKGKRVVREFFTVTLLKPVASGWEFVAVRSTPLKK